MQHFSRPRYIIHDNSHKSDNYFLNILKESKRMKGIHIFFNYSEWILHLFFAFSVLCVLKY